MKKSTGIMICALVGASAFAASAFTLTSYKAAKPERLNVPAMPDTTQKENPFKAEDLLRSRGMLPGPEAAGWTTMVTDTAGRLRFVTPDDVPTLRTYTTRLRAPRFAKGRLVLNSTSRASVKVNGEEKIFKTTADSLPQDADTQIELLPEADYDITVDIVSMPDDKSAPDFSLEFVPADEFKDVQLSAAPGMGKRVSAATAISGERVTSNRISDNGRYLITVSRETVSDRETNRYATLSETASGKVISASIDPDAQWIDKQCAFTTVRERKGAYDVYRTEVPSMTTTLMAKGIPSKDFTLTPDGRYLLYYKDVESEKQTGPMHRYTNPDDRIPGDRDRSYIMRYDLESHVTVPVTYGGSTTAILSMTSDGRKMLYSSSRETPDRFPFYASTLVEVDMNTLKSDTIISNFVQTLTGACYSPDGRQLFITAGPDAFDKIGANYAPHEIGNDFDAQGYIYDIATRKARAMTRDFDPTVEQAAWSEADGRIYFVGETGFYRYLYSLDPKTGKISHLSTDVPYVRNFSLAADNSEWIAYTGGDFTRDGEAFVRNMKNGRSRLVAAPLAETLTDVTFGEMKPWVFTASDGTKVDGWMCLPPDFDASKKYPLIVYYYGGTSPSEASFRHLYSPQVFASRDYVVYVLNPSGTTGYGQEYSARHVNAWGKRTAEEIIEGTKKFCAEHKFVDEKKIGCIGASYGGFMTQYLQTLTDIFAAAVSHAGISNVTSYWGEGYWGYSYNSVAAAKSYPWTDPDLFTKQGSLFNADKIHTPLLLLHGTVDTNVPIGESIQLFNALKILGRDVEFITVSDENHVISGYDNRLAWQNTIMAWFAKHLQDDPRWWNSLYGK